MRWKFMTEAGPIYIVPKNGRFVLFFEGVDLDGFATPNQAAEDASGGHTFTPPSGIDLGSLGIPEDLSDWDMER